MSSKNNKKGGCFPVLLLFFIFIAACVGFYYFVQNHPERFEHFSFESISQIIQAIRDNANQNDVNINKLPEANGNKTPALQNHINDIEFNPEYSIYYAQLTADEQEIYAQVYDAISNCTNEVVIDHEVAQASIDRIMASIHKDQPQFFWLDSSYYIETLRSLTKTTVTLSISFNDLALDFEKNKRRFDAAAEEILSMARAIKTQEEQELYIHDVITQNVSYIDNSEYNQTAYSAIVNHKSVCAGHARAFQYFMRELGIPCYYSTGTASQENKEPESHGWNIVKLNGKYYNVDVTWDKLEPKDHPELTKNIALYRYFNRSDAYFQKYKHKRETDPKLGDMSLPSCMASDASFDNVFGAPQVINSFAREFDITAEDYVQNLDEYYKRCYAKLLASSEPDIVHYLIVSGADTKADIDNQTNEQWQKGYLNKAFEKKFKKYTNYQVSMKTIEIGDDLWFFEVHHVFYNKGKNAKASNSDNASPWDMMRMGN